MEDYMDNKEFEEVTARIMKDIENGKPEPSAELHSAYLLTVV